MVFAVNAKYAMEEDRKLPRVLVVGCGPAGSLMAVYMAKRGWKVDVYERRTDIRKEEVVEGRSINLALSARGLAALEKVGLSHVGKSLGMCSAYIGFLSHLRDPQESQCTAESFILKIQVANWSFNNMVSGKSNTSFLYPELS